MFPYHILVTLDRNYLKVLSVMLYSLSQSDPEGVYTVYVVNNTLTEEDFASLSALLPRTELVNVQVPVAKRSRFRPLPHRDVLPPVCCTLPSAAT